MTKNFDPEKDYNFSNITPDETFRANLRFKLMEKLNNPKANFMQNIFSKKLIFSLTGAAAVLIIALVAFQNILPGTTRVAARQGFGALPNVTGGGFGAGGMGGDAAALSARPQSGGAAPAISEGAKVADLSIMPAPDYLPPIVTYIWEGEAPELPAEMTVLRDRPLDLGRSVIGTMAKLTGVGALSNASSGFLQNISFSLPNLAYTFNVDQSGRYNMWSTGSYGEYRQPKPEDIPADAELIGIANDFLNKMGIDRAKYGEPFVDTTWKEYALLNSTEGRIAPEWVPAQVAVSYPETMSDLPVLNWSGNLDGAISVNVDIFKKSVMGMNGRGLSNKDQSLYPTKNKDQIKAEVLKGGVNPWWGSYPLSLTPEQEARRPKVTITLNNDAKLGYLQQFKYDANQSQTFWLPVITLRGNLTDQYGNKQIYNMIVPVIQGDFFEQPRIMPMEKSVR